MKIPAAGEGVWDSVCVCLLLSEGNNTPIHSPQPFTVMAREGDFYAAAKKALNWASSENQRKAWWLNLSHPVQSCPWSRFLSTKVFLMLHSVWNDHVLISSCIGTTLHTWLDEPELLTMQNSDCYFRLRVDYATCPSKTKSTWGNQRKHSHTLKVIFHALNIENNALNQCQID